MKLKFCVLRGRNWYLVACCGTWLQLWQLGKWASTANSRLVPVATVMYTAAGRGQLQAAGRTITHAKGAAD